MGRIQIQANNFLAGFFEFYTVYAVIRTYGKIFSAFGID